ncbi:MAG: MTH1187 family thiamine-binding protein, partial [Pseudomonadota bacterium]
MAVMEVNIIPLGLGQPSIGDHIAKVARYLDDEHIPYELGDLGTSIEGETAWLLQLAARLHELPFELGAQRVHMTINIDDRRDKEVHLGEKSRS